MTFRPMPILTGLSLISLAILIWLGNWQYDRYSEKMARPAIAELAEQPERLLIAIDRTIDANVQQVYGFADSEPIWRRYAPGRLQDTGEFILVMVGATGGPAPVPIAVRKLPESITFDGLVAPRPVSDSAFSARDNPDADQWYRLDAAKIGAKFNLTVPLKVAEPIVMTVTNAADATQSRLTANPYAFAEPLDPLPPERHFGYALTWWGMALALIGVYAALHRARGRLKF